MFRRYISNRFVIPILLCLQLVPLVLFPASSFSLSTQEWWLPIVLCLLAIIALIQLVFRRSVAAWPWYLLAFSQGFNIISRLMMLLSHAAISGPSGELKPNGQYIVIAFATMLFSAFSIWYSELPEVRQKLVSSSITKQKAQIEEA
jgi:hypothetical protein